jgi:threonine dehydrogenase-like Zn-dependent dehydrogenase
MRAAVLRGAARPVVEGVPAPKPRKGEGLIKMRRCGIHGIDLRYYESCFTSPGEHGGARVGRCGG